MRKAIIVTIFSLFCFHSWGQKRELIEKVVKSAKDYTGIASVISIIQSDRDIYQYIPNRHPLGEQNYRVTSGFGYRQHPISKTRKFHSGIDYASDYANKVYASSAGTVVFAGSLGGYGNTVILKHKYGFETYYAHLTYIYTKQGDKVKSGSVIGFVGSTGNSTGNHLHFEVRKNGASINPTPFIEGGV